MGNKSLAIVGNQQQREIATAREPQDGLTFGDMMAMGQQLVTTGFLPNHIRTAAQFAAIVMTGRELGMTPMRAVRSLQMVQGKVLEDAASQLARFKACGGRADWGVLSAERAELSLTHLNGDRHTETYTLDDAKRAGLVGKGPWSAHPKAMLRSRAITAGLKSLGWDGAVGAYDPSEFEGVAEIESAPSVRHLASTENEKTTRAVDVVSDSLDFAAAIVTESDAEGLALAFDAVERVTGGSPKLSMALVALIEQRAAQLADVEWTADEQRQKAVAWIRGEIEKREKQV